MALRRFLVFVERHHIHRAHLFQTLAQPAASLFFGGQLLACQPRNLRVGAQHLRLNVHLGKAARLKVLQIGAQLGQLARKPCAILAQLVHR